MGGGSPCSPVLGGQALGRRQGRWGSLRRARCGTCWHRGSRPGTFWRESWPWCPCSSGGMPGVVFGQRLRRRSESSTAEPGLSLLGKEKFKEGNKEQTNYCTERAQRDENTSTRLRGTVMHNRLIKPPSSNSTPDLPQRGLDREGG